MPTLTLGITVLLARLFPFGAQLLIMLLGGMSRAIYALPWLHAVMLLANYIPPAVVAVIFVRQTQLKTRLPKEIPGRTPILIGLILVVLYLALGLFAPILSGGELANVVSRLGPLFTIPADVLIIVGVVKALLAALPQLTTHSTGPARKAAQSS